MRAEDPGAEPLDATRRLRAVPVIRRLVALVAILMLAGCTSGAVQIPGSGPLVTVQMRGGECVSGPCDNTVILERDGRVHAAAKPPNDLGHVPADVMATLTAAVAQTDYAAIKSHPFTGECPTAFDGQELIVEFAVGTGTERISSCEVAIDWGHPLFVAVGVALGAWVAIPRT